MLNAAMLAMTQGSKHLKLVIIAWIALLMLALGLALYSQHALGMQPCPWCVIQRLLMLISLLLSTIMLGSVGLAIALALPALAHLMVQAAGLSASLYQALVASQDSQCALGLADQILMASGLEQHWPWMFAAATSCAEASQASFFGISFPWLAFGLFGMGILLSLLILRYCLRVGRLAGMSMAEDR